MTTEKCEIPTKETMHKSPWNEQSKARMYLELILLLKPKFPESFFTKYAVIYITIRIRKKHHLSSNLKYISFQTPSLPQYHLSKSFLKGIANCMLSN